MCLPGNPRILLAELPGEPQCEKDERGYRYEEYEHQRGDLVFGKQHEIRPENPGYRTRRPNERDDTCSVGGHKPERRDDPRYEVPDEVSHRSVGLFDVVAEDPQEPDVEDDVEPRSVEKHRSEDRSNDGLVREHASFGLLTARVVVDLFVRYRFAGDDLARNGGVLIEKLAVGLA